MDVRREEGDKVKELKSTLHLNKAAVCDKQGRVEDRWGSLTDSSEEWEVATVRNG
jgi:hypothetical protein